jgi:hypothetical protein
VRITASGLVVVSALVALVALVALGCGDKKPRDGLPPSADWQAPAGQDGAVPPVLASPEDRLAGCAASAFVDDAARDGNLPDDVLEDLNAVPDAKAIVLLRALARASSRLPAADQQAMLLASAALHLAQRGETRWRTPVERATALLERESTNDMRTQIAAANTARTWGRLGDADAIARLGDDPRLGPHLARGLAEGGHVDRAAQLVARLESSDTTDGFAMAELPITHLVLGRFDVARAAVAASPVDWRAIHALLLARAAVEHRHARARELVADAGRFMDAETTVPSAEIDLATFELAVGDRDGSAARRARLRTSLAAEPDDDRARMAYYNLHVLAARAGAADEARTLLGDLQSRRAAPWMMTLARSHGLAVSGHPKEAIEEVERLPLDAAPPRGVIDLDALMAYLAGPQDPELERWLTTHICAGDP